MPKYTAIKNKTQYKDYCNILEELVFKLPTTESIKNEIESLTPLIEKYDEEHDTFNLEQ